MFTRCVGLHHTRRDHSNQPSALKIGQADGVAALRLRFEQRSLLPYFGHGDSLGLAVNAWTDPKIHRTPVRLGSILVKSQPGEMHKKKPNLTGLGFLVLVCQLDLTGSSNVLVYGNLTLQGQVF